MRQKMGETKASLVRIALSLYLIHLSQCHMNLDPKRDPVLQRLDIPARETVSEQEFTLEPKIKSADDSASFVRRLWGIPDVTAEVGKEFSLVFPSDAFEGHVSRYEVARSDSEALPWWLRFDREKGTLWGKPQPEHVGNWYIKVRAYGAHPHQVATDVFAIQVVNQTCSHLALSVTFDLDFFTAAPKTRQRLVSALSRHFRVTPADISLKESRRVKPADWVKAGPGNVLLPVNSHLTNAVIRFQCSRVNDTTLWSELKKQAANGELSDRVGHSITGWFLSKVEAEPGRLRREVNDEGSGDDEDYDYEENHEGDEETDILPETAVVPSQNAPVSEEQPSSTPPVATTPSTTTTTTPAPAEPISPAGPEVEATPVVKLEPSSSVLAIPKEPKIEAEPPQVPPSEEPAPAPTAFPDDYDENEVEGTDEESVKTPHNSPPVVNKRLPRLTVTAGKILRFTVPSDTFTDLEDGSSRSLKLQLVPTESRELADIAWIGFDVQEQTIYGLPLAEDIGRWNFLLRATDKKGESVQEQVEIVVRQHQSERTFNHRFSMQLKPEFSEDEESIPKAHWLLNIVDAIYMTTGDKSGDSVVVRSLAGDFKTDQPFSLSWSNESLSRQHCQEDAIHEILEKFFHSETSEITQEFEDNLPVQFVANAVSLDLEGICKSIPTAATLPPVREIPPVTEKVNEPPQVRNAVDQITAEVGSLLRFQVPEDTFFDPEDGNTRMLRLQLLSSDRQPLDPKLWLQFDAANQEFYGLPLESDAGSEEYQLRATDTIGLMAHDGLVVFVKPRPKEESFSVEFSLKINVDHESIATSAHRKARLLETIAEIFGDSDSRNVVVKSLVEGSTIISWSNKSLPVSPCPGAEIHQLRRALLDEDGKLTARAAELLSAADFEPQSATLLPLGACVGELTPTHLPDSAVGEETEAETEKPEGSWTDDYLLTFIVPGIIIAAMLLLAVVIACVLYRRRRTGKLGLEERRSFVSKGIPIIFAEELEERPSSGRHSVKSPVILKDERPAQPPDYRKVRSSASPTPQPRVPAEQRDLLRSPSDETADDEPAAPYQPPPPLAAGSGRDSMKSARPKTTSAYRKPPPYVPP